MAEDSAGPAADPLAAVGRRLLPGLMIESRDRREVRLSRFKVARLIDAAGESGIVHIEIRYVDGLNVDL